MAYQITNPDRLTKFEDLLADARLEFSNNPTKTGLATYLYAFIKEEITTLSDGLPGGPFAGTGQVEIPVDGVDIRSWLWVTGAEKVNKNEGFNGTFIQEFTEEQFKQRNGEEIADGRAQKASNEVALNFFTDIEEAIEEGRLNHIPDIARIGIHDAGAAAGTVFDGEYAPWAGTLLFPYLGYDDVYTNWLLTNEKVNFDANTGESDTFSVVEGTYNLFSTIQAARAAGQSAAFSSFGSFFQAVRSGIETTLGLVPTGAFDGDHDDLIDATNLYFNETYGFDTNSTLFTPGSATVFAGGFQLFGEKYRVGTLNDDTLVLTGDAEAVNGGLGDDLFQVEQVLLDGGADLIDGGAGFDTVSYQTASDGVEVTFEKVPSLSDLAGAYENRILVEANFPGVAGVIPSLTNPDFLYSIEAIKLSSLDDIIREAPVNGTAANPDKIDEIIELKGTGKAPTADVSAKFSELKFEDFGDVEFIDGGAGDDFIAGTSAAGGIELLGGEGDDIVYLGQFGPDSLIHGGAGNDWVITLGGEGVPPGRLLGEVNDLLQNWHDDGFTRFLDVNNRPIIYGTNEADEINYGLVVEEPGTFLLSGGSVENTPGYSILKNHVENGLVFVLGGGNDKAVGSSANDEIFGGLGNDWISATQVTRGFFETQGFGAGDDLYHGGEIGKDWALDGEDTVNYEGVFIDSQLVNGIEIEFSISGHVAEQFTTIEVVNDGTGGHDKLLSIEYLQATSNDDTVRIDKLLPLYELRDVTINGLTGTDLIEFTDQSGSYKVSDFALVDEELTIGGVKFIDFEEIKDSTGSSKIYNVTPNEVGSDIETPTPTEINADQTVNKLIQSKADNNIDFDDITQIEFVSFSSIEEISGGSGDDFLASGAEPQAIELKGDADGDIVILQNALSGSIASGGSGNDWVIALGGEGVTTIGGSGKDFIFNTSKGGVIYGDTIDQQFESFSPEDDNSPPLEPDSDAESDMIWFWEGVTFADPSESDFLAFYGIPLVGGTSGLPLSTGLSVGGIFAVGLGNYSPQAESLIYFDELFPHIVYQYDEGQQKLKVTNLLTSFLGAGRIEDILGLDGSIIPIGTMVIDNYENFSASPFGWGLENTGDVHLSFKQPANEFWPVHITKPAEIGAVL